MTDNDRSIDRREALAGIGFSAMAAYGVGTPTWHRFQRLLAGGELRAFFTAAEMALLGRLTDMIIPSDDRSGSAVAQIPGLVHVTGPASLLVPGGRGWWPQITRTR